MRSKVMLWISDEISGIAGELDLKTPSEAAWDS
jgi:hypothetical protein